MTSRRFVAPGKMAMPHRTQRQHCYLCDLPRTPWAMLHDFTEAVCRGCVNYEGPDRIEMVIESARQMKRTQGLTENRVHQAAVTAVKPSAQLLPSPRTSEIRPDRLHNLQSAAESMRSPVQDAYRPLHDSPVARQRALMEFTGLRNQTDANPASPGRRVSPQQNHVTSMLPPVRTIQGSRRDDDILSNHSSSDGERHDLNSNTNMPPLVRDTLALLAACTPFDVRFKKDISLKGRVFHFDYISKPGPAYELKIYMEYPTGTGQVYTSASGVAKQMYQDSGKEVGKTLSSGFKYLDYEMRHGSGDFRLLGDMLPEDVRVFKEPIKKELLPVPYIDAVHPILPTTMSRSSTSTRIGGTMRSMYEIPPRKRKMSPEPGIGSPTGSKQLSQEEQHKRWLANQNEAFRLAAASGYTTSPSGPPSSSSSLSNAGTPPEGPGPGPSQSTANSGQSPMTALISVTDNIKSSTAGTHRRHSLSSSTQSPPPRNRSASISEPGINGNVPESTVANAANDALRCTLCNERLEDTHFVQCPSTPEHKFCFPCSKESIRQQGAGNEVYCPSGKRCPLAGSSIPWAFMQGEISTIMGEEFMAAKNSVTVKKEVTSPK